MRTKTHPKVSLVMSVFLVGMASAIAAGGTIYVDADASPGGDGASWGTAYKYLQDALNKPPTSGDEIWVAAGTYKPGPSRSHSFQMKNGVGIYGGFAGDEDPNLFDPADRDFTTNETILSGDIGVAGNNADNSYHVIYNQQGTTLDSSAVLDGFTITTGNANGGSPAYGGGMLNYGTSNYPCSPTITNCTFYDNYGSMGGGMFNISYSSPILINCTFHDNLAGFGGGMGNFSYSSPTVINCVFYNNTTIPGGTGGGGMYNGIYSEPIVTNCTFSGNSAVNGGGIYSEGLSSPVVTNCVLWADSATVSGDEIFHTFDSTPVVTYCDVQAGTGQIWFGVGCIDDDPCLADAATGDFHLLSDSPCIDSGTNSAPSLPGTDFEGDPRIINGTVDMGVDESVRYELVTITEPEQGGTIALTPPGGDYLAGTEVTVTANAAEGYVFDHWSGDLTGSTNPDSVIMDANKTVTAHFVAEFTLTVTADPFNGGTVTLNPPGGVYVEGTMVTLTANAAVGYALDHWSGDLTGSTNPDSVIMDANKTVTAHFVPEFTLTGNGTAENPYQIWDAVDVNTLGANPAYYSSHFIMMADVNMSGVEYTRAVIAPDTVVDMAFQGAKFTGVFDGNNCVIRNLTIDTAGVNKSYLGLFGYISGGVVKNLGLEGVQITGGSGSPIRFGALAGYNWLGQIFDCYSAGVVDAGGGGSAGGLIGGNSGTMSRCYSTGFVFGGDIVGGLAAVMGTNSGTISRCYSRSVVFGNDYVGGLVGMNYDRISDCYSTGGVFGSTTVGGLVGRNFYRLSKSYSNGIVYGSTEVGGLAGYNGEAGGYEAIISDCYWDELTSLQSAGVGAGDANGVAGKTTFEMKQEGTYSGWNFVDTWYIVEDAIYPILSWERTPFKGDLNLDGAVDFYDFAIIANRWLLGVEN